MRYEGSRPSRLYGRVPYNWDAYNWILTVPPARPQLAEWVQHTTERASWGQPPQPVGLKRSHDSPQPPFHSETMLGGDTPYAPPGADHPHPLRLRIADSRTELSCFVFHCCRERTGLYATCRRVNRRLSLQFLAFCVSSSGAPGGTFGDADRVPGEVQPSVRTGNDQCTPRMGCAAGVPRGWGQTGMCANS